MKISLHILIMLSLLPLGAAVENLTVEGSTSTQLIASYVAPTNAACTVEVSESSTYTPLARDVDPAYFAGADSDLRTGNVSLGRFRRVVVGKQGFFGGVMLALDGHKHSRALRADADYFIRITCGGDTATTRGRTKTIPWGDTRGEPMYADGLWSYMEPSRIPVVNPSFPDPYTGTLVVNDPALLGIMYTNSTAKSGYGGYSPGSECNQTMTGYTKGACKFETAAGTNWTYTSTSLTAAVRAEDSNYAEYSGTAQEKLFLQFDNANYPAHNTYGSNLSFRNMALRAKASSTTNDGEAIGWCLTWDGSTCGSPAKTLNLTTSFAAYVLCNTSPCAAPETPGDLIGMSAGQVPGIARIYNVSGSLDTIRFSGPDALAACNFHSVGEVLGFYDSRTNGTSLTYITITAKSCGSSPPQVTISSSPDITYNSTTGVPFAWLPTHNSSVHHGLLVWKSSTTEASTISVDFALMRAASTGNITLGMGSGGFGKRCSMVALSGGWYPCMTSQDSNMIIAFRTNPSTGLVEWKNFGLFVKYPPDLNSNLSYLSYLSCSSNAGVSDAMWSDSEAGVFYCIMPSNYPNPASGGTVDKRAVIVKVTLALSDPATANPDGANDVQDYPFALAPQAAVASTEILTPCLSTCTDSATQDYTLRYQLTRYNSNYNHLKWGGVVLTGVQGNALLISATNGTGNDVYGWLFKFNLTTNLIDAGFFVPAATTARHCSVHTMQSPLLLGGATFNVPETGNKCQFQSEATSSLADCDTRANGGIGNCGACPNVTLDPGTADEYNYNGKNWCSTLNLTSSYPGGGGETAYPDGAWTAGDPVNKYGCSQGGADLKWIQKWAVGDLLHTYSGGAETLRIIEKVSDTEYTVIRGWGSMCPSPTCSSSDSYTPSAHESGIDWSTWCGAVRKLPTEANPEQTVGLSWFFNQDPDGNDDNYTFLNWHMNHGINVANLGLRLDYPGCIGDMSDPAVNKECSRAGGGNFYNALPTSFAGKTTNCGGNGCEKHPTYGQLFGDPNFFTDVNPQMYQSMGTNGVALVAGKSHIYKYQGTAPVDVRHFNPSAYMGKWPFQWADSLTDDSASTGKACHAAVANDCFSGDVAGTTYFTNTVFDTTFIALQTCRETAFGAISWDFCIHNSNGIGASISRWLIRGAMAAWNGLHSQATSKVWRTYREAPTENVKITPDGSAILARDFTYRVTPGLAPFDTRNRSTFQAVTVTLTSPPNTSTAYVEFGYDETFRCSVVRSNACVAEAATINLTTPFKWSHETITGVSCASGCAIAIPAVGNRTLYYRKVFRDAGGAVIHRSGTEIVAAP